MSARAIVMSLLEQYPEKRKRIDMLNYELEHPSQVDTREVIDSMAFSKGEGVSHQANHVSNRTMYIALNYRNQAELLNQETMDELIRMYAYTLRLST